MTENKAEKLLRCPSPWRGDDGSIQQCVERGHCGCGENTRPQPAPPAGESDFVGMAGEISNLLGEARAIPHVKIIEAALCDAYDIGLAARPKVEDAEYATQDDVERALLREHELRVAAESKLAEREAELAKADAVVKAAVQVLARMEATSCTWRDYSILVLDEQIKRHAARQQQKASAEPTEREGSDGTPS